MKNFLDIPIYTIYNYQYLDIPMYNPDITHNKVPSPHFLVPLCSRHSFGASASSHKSAEEELLAPSEIL